MVCQFVDSYGGPSEGPPLINFKPAGGRNEEQDALTCQN